MAPAPGSGWPRDEPAARVQYRYVPLGAAAGPGRRRHEEYATRRALFVQSYRFSTDGRDAGDDDDDRQGEGLRGRLARRLRDARLAGRDAFARAVCRARGAARWWVGAGPARAWRGWIRAPRAQPLGFFGPLGHKYNLHDFV